jgi:two-component sensor histidine kinase
MSIQVKEVQFPGKIDHADVRGNRILEVIMSYARLDFSQRTDISNKGDVFDAIGAGVNMLGEELKSSTLSLREKEQLLREIHHRVKNNLQIISSLLNLQTEYTQDENFLALIRESRNRIRSMALVHEMLYATKDLSRIKLSDYIRTLYYSIYQSYSLPDTEIHLHLDIHNDASLEIERMIPLGLIINEILSNSFKYAFGKNRGNISISFEYMDGKYILIISDDGIGLPEDFNRHKQASLGMQLIFMLSEQISGIAEMKNCGGLSYRICF